MLIPEGCKEKKKKMSSTEGVADSNLGHYIFENSHLQQRLIVSFYE